MYTVAVNIVLAVILMQPFGYVGLALASALASFFNVGLLWSHLHKKHGAIFDATSWKRMFSAALACTPMAALLYITPSFWSFPSDKLMQFVWLTVLVLASMLVFFASAWALGERKLLKPRV